MRIIFLPSISSTVAVLAAAAVVLLAGTTTNNRNNAGTVGVIVAVQAFQTTTSRIVPSSRTTATLSTFRRLSSLLKATTVSETSAMVKEMRQAMNENEDARLVMEALRGKNLNDDDSAVAGLQMRLVDVGSSSIDGDVLPYDYDPDALKAFFQKRPLTIARRITQVTSTAGFLAFQVALDQLLGRTKNNPDLEVRRAAQLRDTITSLGPFFIKIGQALSIRPDILSPRSMVELQKLCDKVPSYDSKIAFATIEKELGKPIDELFSEITPEPVAAASLGQVYKATLRGTGEVVAVKVQRPAVLETVSLDLYLARELGQIARNFPALVQRLDAVALLDEFAFRFYQELDYNLECANGIRIAEDMSVLPMVVIPKNYPELTSRRVHVAEWIDGEKLSQSTSDDVSSLVNLGVIVYLEQLLNKGFFHADPHPGNMMRTKDGKLAILDFGLMTEITDNQKYGMIEAIAHLINRDYEEIGQDFVNLDFIPEGTDTAPIVPALTKVFDVALAGGGAKSINFQELAADLAEITYEFPFKIPPYFALVIRAISVLEGIALVGNPEFAIIDEAYPYLARRLMTDNSPRLRAALRYMVYGRQGEFDAERLIDLLEALEKFKAIRDDGDGTAYKVDGVRGNKVVGSAGDFRGSQVVDTSDRDTDVGDGRFRVTTATPRASSASRPQSSIGGLSNIGGSNFQRQSEEDKETLRESLRFFFSPEGEPFRDFMLEEIVTVVDASSREAVNELVRNLGLSNFPLPSLFKALNPELNDTDKRMVQQIGKLIQFLFGDFDSALGDGARNGGGMAAARARALLPVVREYRSELSYFGRLLVARLTEKNLQRSLNWASNRLTPEPMRLTPESRTIPSSRRKFLNVVSVSSAAFAMSTFLPGVSPANAGGLLQFPPGDGRNPPLKNKYHLMRAGISELEAEEGIYSTNALFLTNRENQLDTSVGIKQVSKTIEQLTSTPGVLSPTVVYHSLAANGMDTGDQIARELRLGRDRLLPEFTYLDPRGIGLWDSSDVNEIQPAIWAMDYDEAGPLGLGGRPPAKDDGTANEVLHDQFIRLRQFVSLQESRTAGEIILIIFPDSTGPALLSCMFGGIPFNEVHSLEFEPGEIRFDVTRESILSLWKERREDPAYLTKIQEGREKLAALRRDVGGGEVNRASYTNGGTNGNFVSKKDEKIERERLEIERTMQEKKEADAAREQAAREERAEAEARRRQEYERQRNEQMEERQRRQDEAMEAARQKAVRTASEPRSLSPEFLGVGGVGALSVGVLTVSLLGTGEGKGTTDGSVDQVDFPFANVTSADMNLATANVTTGQSMNDDARKSGITNFTTFTVTNGVDCEKLRSSPEEESVASNGPAQALTAIGEDELAKNETTGVVTNPSSLSQEPFSAVSNPILKTNLYGGTSDFVVNTVSQAKTEQRGDTSPPTIDEEDGEDDANDWLRMLSEIRDEDDDYNEEDNGVVATDDNLSDFA